MPAWTRRSFLVSSAAAGLAAALKPSAHGARRELTWTDVADWRIEGRAFAERKAPFDRLPAAAEGIVRDDVWKLSRDSAGMAVRFTSAATELHVRYRLTRNELAMAHMPATGVSGVDLYSREANSEPLRWCAVTRPQSRTVEARLVTKLPAKEREWLLYLPLYNGVESLAIGTPESSTIAPHEAPAGKPIVVYGTSIAHGACASRPGMAWPAIVGRHLAREVINLGFSGNGRMEAEVGRFVREIDASAFVIDCLPNMSTADLVAQRTAPLAQQLRERHPKTPLLFVEDRTFGNAWIDPEVTKLHEARRQALRVAIAELRKTDANVHLLSGETLLGTDSEGTTDGSHPNDLGMLRQAEIVAAALKPLLA